MAQAIEIAQRDYARLLHLHDVIWETDLVGAVLFRCSCSETTGRNAASLESHIKESIRKERGPTRPPNNKFVDPKK